MSTIFISTPLTTTSNRDMSALRTGLKYLPGRCPQTLVIGEYLRETIEISVSSAVSNLLSHLSDMTCNTICIFFLINDCLAGARVGNKTSSGSLTSSVIKCQHQQGFHSSPSVWRIIIGPPNSGDGSGASVGDGGKNTSRSSGTTTGGGKDGQLSCPKCGSPCNHVDTFVCKFPSNSVHSFLLSSTDVIFFQV